MNPNFRNFALWAIIALLLIALFSMFQTSPAQTSSREIPYSQFLREVDSGRVRDVTVTGNRLIGSYVENGTTVNLAWNYDAANALAVTQSSVTGTWTQTGSSLTIAEDGTLTGTLSGCPVSGTLLLTTPSSGKNLYTLSITGTTASCTLQSGTTYSGHAAIKFLPISGSSLYTRSILFIIKSASNSTVAYGQLKQQ